MAGEFKSETVLVEVPVIVTDKSGNHVQGSRTDFEILEAGKEQKISSFEEIQTTLGLLSAFRAGADEYRNDGASGDAPPSDHHHGLVAFRCFGEVCGGRISLLMDTPSAVPGGYLTILYERAVQALNVAQISVYPIDVRGPVDYYPQRRCQPEWVNLSNATGRLPP